MNDISDTLQRLTERLPLARRQAALTPDARGLHRQILTSFRDSGLPPTQAEIRGLPTGGAPARLLADLAARDLIVRGPDGAVEGAYPFTVAHTPHLLTLGDHRVHAMCAFDALGVAPMFDTRVTVESHCEVTEDPIRVVQKGWTLVHAKPSREIRVGIQWRAVADPAADGL